MLLFFTGLLLAVSFKSVVHILAMSAAILCGVSLPSVLSFSKRLRTIRLIGLIAVALVSFFFFGRVSYPLANLVWMLVAISYYFAFASIFLAERKVERETEARARLARFALRDDLNQIFSRVRNVQPSSVVSIPIDATRLPEYSHIASVFGRNGWEVDMRFERREGVTLHLRAPSSMKDMDRSLTTISCEAC